MKKYDLRKWNILVLFLAVLLCGCGREEADCLPVDAARCSVKAYLPADTTPPAISGIGDHTLYVGQTPDYLQGVTVTDDLDTAPSLLVNDSRVDLTKDGVYSVMYLARDFSGNMTIQTGKLTVIRDCQDPSIFGVNPLSVVLGNTVSYRSGILVEDDYTAQPILTVDSSQADLSKPGSYPVIYRARDDAGNETVVETVITVHEPRKNYVEADVVYAEADKLLDKIIKDGMTTRQQVEAIYKWFQKNCYYISSSDKSDKLQAAYKILTGKRGDCYNYYAACSLLLERLGIPQISVERAPDAKRNSHHYWSMVSLDNGETYYHVDVSPHVHFSIETCLVTDSVLARCNAYAPGYYDMEEGRYPRTPEM